ncbi:MAG: hypothetical protein M1831_004101 [Alyxoria varia]|nr:MAG: hypothetical protein M1831_004101 [Alyxoria varia]
MFSLYSFVAICAASVAADVPLVSAFLQGTPTEPSETPSAVAAGGETYWITPAGAAPTPLNKVGTYLYGYNGCDRAQRGKINDAFYDAWVMSKIEGVYRNIDWNSAPALEFLGAPGVNKDQQAQIQAVFANMATVIYSYINPFQHPLHVRCDDPKKECQKRPDNDPCQPDPPNDGAKPKPTPEAYALNSDPDDSYPMINFCDGFHNSRSLEDAIKRGTALRKPNNFKIDEYHNRAQIFFHELTHLHLAADSEGGSPNPEVWDLTISIKLTSDRSWNTVAYGGLSSKLIARYQTETGYYVQRNADNFAFYATAKYIMTRNKNVYPHLPVVKYELSGPPWREVFNDASLVASFNKDGALNVTNADEITNLDETIPELGDYPGCVDDLDPADAPKILEIDGLLKPDAYPDEYNKLVLEWLKDLGDDSAPTPSTEPSAPAGPTATVSATSPKVKCDSSDPDSCKGVLCTLIGASPRCVTSEDERDPFCLCTASIG